MDIPSKKNTYNGLKGWYLLDKGKWSLLWIHCFDMSNMGYHWLKYILFSLIWMDFSFWAFFYLKKHNSDSQHCHFFNKINTTKSMCGRLKTKTVGLFRNKSRKDIYVFFLFCLGPLKKKSKRSINDIWTTIADQNNIIKKQIISWWYKYTLSVVYFGCS